MCNLKPLKIGELTARLPIIQGGMGVGISLSSLAGAVAKEGGVGIISTAQIGFREPDFAEDSQAANLRAIGTEFKKAREISPDGIIGFNIMVATRNYAEYVKAAVKAGANLIISGAGLPINLPEYVKGSATKIAPIVSSVKSAMVICKMWDRKYKTAPDLVVVEGPLAGGHLGFDRDKLHELGADTEHAADTFKKAEYDDEIRGIIALVKEYAQKYEKEIRSKHALSMLAAFGGLDIAGMAGVCIGGALYHVPVVLDGLISSVAALVAERIVPGVREFVLPSHLSKEPAAKWIAEELKLHPVIDAGLGLGEGTGAVMLFSLLDLALALYEDQTTFDTMEIAQYERYGETE